MAEGRLPVPVRRVLDDSLSDAKLARLWRDLAVARSRRGVPVKRAVAVGCAAVLAVAAIVFFLRSPRPDALHLRDGHDVPSVMASGAVERLSFDDGSAIDVAEGTALDLLESTPRSFAMAIRAGAIDVDVTPGGPRTWRIECGPVTVEVVGTRFTVQRSAQYVRVAVSRGAVLVRGDAVPDRVVRLGPGQAIVVPIAAWSGARGRAAPAVVDSTDMADMNPPATPRSPAPRASATARSVPAAEATSARPAEASKAPGAPPASSVAQFVAPSASTVADGLAGADALRRAGRFAEAAAVLERTISEHGGDPSIPLAEFSLGRLYLDAMNDAALAKVHFARALGRGLPSALAEDAEARLVEASARAPDLRGAREAASRYRAHYPNGRHASDVDRWSPPGP